MSHAESESVSRRVGPHGDHRSAKVVAMAKKMGRPLKGGVTKRPLTVRIPEPYFGAYQQQSQELGIPLSDVILYYAFQGAGLPVPDYITDAIEANRNQLQQALVA